MSFFTAVRSSHGSLRPNAAVGASCALFLLPAYMRGQQTLYLQAATAFLSDYLLTGRDSVCHPLDRTLATLHFAYAVYRASESHSVPFVASLALVSILAFYRSRRCLLQGRYEDYVRCHVWWHVVATIVLLLVL